MSAQTFFQAKWGFQLFILGLGLWGTALFFLPGWVKPGDSPSPIPYLLFILGSTCFVWGAIKMLGALLIKVFLSLFLPDS